MFHKLYEKSRKGDGMMQLFHRSQKFEFPEIQAGKMENICSFDL